MSVDAPIDPDVDVEPPAPTLPDKSADTFRWVATAVIVVAVLWSITDIDIKWSRIIDLPGDLYTVGRLMFTRMERGEIGELSGAMWESIAIAWMGTLIASVFAVPLSFLAAENLVGPYGAVVTRQVFNILRAIPEVILAIALIPVFGLSPLTGVIALGIGSIGTLGKLFYEVIEGIDPAPSEAADAVGANALQRFRWGVLPQVAPELTSLLLYRFEVNIRASAVLGLIGAGGIGADLADAIRFKDWGTAGLGLIIVVAGTIGVDVVSGIVRRRIVRGPERSSGSGENDEADPASLVAAAPGTLG
mgnify:CR=1 FL=1